MLTQALMIAEVVSAVLALALVYLFLKIYWLKRMHSLLGLPLGFILLAVSYFLFLVAFYAPDQAAFSDYMWLRVIFQTWGFALITLSFFLSNRPHKTAIYYILSVFSWSLVLSLCVLGLLAVVYPVSLSSVYSANDYFTVVNLILLTCVISFQINRLKMAKNNISELIRAPIAFALLWLGQFSFLIWNLDRGDMALVTSYVAKIIGLLLFFQLYFMKSKEPAIGDGE
ncbi:MAG: hypothetical protein NWE93_06375 [Candidatus Bathyarchaeota archaeon]|nr:hypothetical protein [Candidatus Bathyarchaeota archaeon]